MRVVRSYRLAVDFDEAEWREDAQAFVQSCHELGVSAALEISRSGNGAHAWIFFAGSVSARDARRLGTAIISHICARMRQLKLTSYDRLFPNQDTMPAGGFGNLISSPCPYRRRHARPVAACSWTRPCVPILIRLAAFQNPEFYKAQTMYFSVWDKPRVIGCAENYPNHIALPRGCLDAAKEVMGRTVSAANCSILQEINKALALSNET